MKLKVRPLTSDLWPALEDLFGKGGASNGCWSLSCFYVRRGYREQGVMAALIAAAVKVARRAKVPALEAYPVNTDAPKRTSNLHTGTASVFARAGFQTVACREPSRPVMRHELKSSKR